MVLPIQRNHTISAGSFHITALSKRGSMILWDQKEFGTFSDRGFVAVTKDEGVGLKKDGTIFQAGAQKQIMGNNFVAISTRGSTSLALKNDGSIIQWRDSSRGQDIGFAAHVENKKDFVAISAGLWHNIALKKDGSIVQWGAGDDNQYEDGPIGNYFVAISAGDRHSIALKKDGSIAQWGHTFFNQDVSKPTERGFVAIAAGDTHNLALKNDGSIVQWGATSGGQANRKPTGKGFVAISAGYQESCALKMDGTIVQWGNRKYVQNKWTTEKLMLPSPIPIEMRRLPKNLQKNITKYENYKKILEKRKLFNPIKFNNFEKKLNKKTPAERRTIILQRTNFLNNNNVGNLVNRQALYNTSNLVTQELLKKILNATKVSTAVKKKYINHYKGPLSFGMIQNFKLNSENTLKLLTGNRVVKTNLLKNVMNSKMNKNVKLGFIKKTMTKNGMNKTLVALNKINKVDANFTDPVTYNQGNQVLMNNMIINNAGKLKIREAWAKSVLNEWNVNLHPMTGATGWRNRKKTAKNTSNVTRMRLTMPTKPTGKRAIRATPKTKKTSRRKSK